MARRDTIDAGWAERIEHDRAAKAEYFREHRRLPLPPEMRGDDFPGLDYYDPDYRFVVPMHEHDDEEVVTVSTTADGEQSYLRLGRGVVRRPHGAGARRRLTRRRRARRWPFKPGVPTMARRSCRLPTEHIHSTTASVRVWRRATPCWLWSFSYPC
jgi:uncharacterized protein (DUF1684 family)